MESYVKTRWTADGLVELTVDVQTAAVILGSVPATVDKLLHESLAHTLATPKGDRP